MSIFDLHSAVLTDSCDFVRSSFIITDEQARQFVEYARAKEARLWPDFLLPASHTRKATSAAVCPAWHCASSRRGTSCTMRALSGR